MLRDQPTVDVSMPNRHSAYHQHQDQIRTSLFFVSECLGLPAKTSLTPRKIAHGSQKTPIVRPKLSGHSPTHSNGFLKFGDLLDPILFHNFAWQKKCCPSKKQ